MSQMPNDIPREGLAALRERLGRVGMVRFFQQFETGHGNYVRERHTWVDQVSLNQLRTAAGLPSPCESPKRKRP